MIRSALVLAALAASAAQASAPAAFRALGTEPFWSARVTATTLEFEEANVPGVTRREPVIRHQSNASVSYTESAGMKLWATPATCSDGMSDRIFPLNVVMLVDGRRLEGCGGEPRSGPTHP